MNVTPFGLTGDEDTMSEEERYTKAEWEKIQQDNRIIEKYRMFGIRIDSLQLLRRIMNEISQVCDPEIWKKYIEEII